MNLILNPDGTQHVSSADRERMRDLARTGQSKEESKKNKKHTRGTRKSVFEPDDMCVGLIDPITEKKIVNGFRLEADGRCYDATTISDIRNDLAPFNRKPFTAKDILRRNLFENTHRGGSKRQSKRNSKRPKRH